MMTEEAKAAKAAYMREWRKSNKDKSKEYNARYWQRKAEAAAKEREGAEHGSE